MEPRQAETTAAYSHNADRLDNFSHFKIFPLFLRLPLQMEQTMTLPVADQRKQNIMKAVRDYGRRLFYFIRGRVNTQEDAEDILQDVWYQFSNVMNSEPIEQTSAWLFRVARNRVIDQYRRQRPASLEDEIDRNRKEVDFISEKFYWQKMRHRKTSILKIFFGRNYFRRLMNYRKNNDRFLS